MIQNLHSISDMPAARTNIVQLQEGQLETVRRLLAPVSNIYIIDFGLRRFKKVPRENSRDFHVRMHREVKHIIRASLNLSNEQAVKYEIIRLKTGQHAFFYINKATPPNSRAQEKLTNRISDLCHQLTLNEHSLNGLIQGLFGLHLKMVLLEQATDLFSVEPMYLNSRMFLNARNTAKKNNIMESFELEVFASEQNELAFTLHKRKFLVELGEELNLALNDDTVWFNTASGYMIAKKSLDARDSKLSFFKDRSSYGDCEAYTYNVVMNMVRERLQALDIPLQEITFQATHEVDSYITNLDNILSNHLYVVNAGVEFSPEQDSRFFGFLKEHLPNYTLISEVEFADIQAKGYFNGRKHCSVLMLNPTHEDFSSSIRQVNTDAQNDFDGFFAAYFAHKEDHSREWDLYTTLKIQRLERWLNETPHPLVLQGFNIDKTILVALDYMINLEQTDPIKFTEELSKPKSALNAAINKVVHKIKRIKTELWFKEVLLATKFISPFPIDTGHYTAFFVRNIKNKEIGYINTFLGYVEIVSDGTRLSIKNAGITEGDLEWLATEHEPLQRLAKLYNNSFYLYDHDHDVLLTTYNSIRVPRIIGPTAFDTVEWYAHQEEEKATAEQCNESFTEYKITRSAKPHQNVLPYYLAPGRSKKDPLTKLDKMKHHHIYLQPHDNGIYVLMTSAQPVNSTIAKQILIENLLIWDAEGQPIEAFEHPLTSTYLNSFTLDMLKSGESSKTSVFTKLARLIVEN